MQIETTFKNFKKIEDFTQEFKQGHLYFVQGQNGEGKTSIIDGIKIPITALDKTKVPVTWGQEEGSIINKIIGADGIEYLVRYDFTKDGKGKFRLFNAGISTTKVGEIRNIFQYNDFTVEEMLSWTGTADGRKKIREIFLSMLPENNKKQFFEYEQQEQEAYDKRTVAGKLLEEKKLLFSHSSITEEQQELLTKEEYYQNEYKIAKEALDANIEVNLKFAEKVQLIENIAAKDVELLNLKNIARSNHQEYTSEIERLKAEIIRYEKKIADNKENFELKADEIKASVEEYNKQLEECPEEYVDEEEFRVKTEDFETILKAISNIKEKQSGTSTLKMEVDKYQKEYNLQDNNVKEARISKEKVILDSDMPIKNIVVHEEGISVKQGDNLVPFTITDLSYSEAGFIAAQIILERNKKLPLLLLGRAESYDKDKFSKLLQLAKEKKAIIIGDRVTMQGGLEIVCYEE